MSVVLDGNFQADHGLALREALVAGRSFGVAHRWPVADLLASGRLVVLLPKHQLEPVPFHVLTMPGRSKLERVRLLVDFLADRFTTVPGMIR